MGLDMYLTAERYLWSYPSDGPDQKIGEAIKEMFPELNEHMTVQTVSAEVGYWRKANAIHKWFVDNVQDGVDDCRSAVVDYEQLVTLRDLCQKVLDNRDQAAELLPTQSGFFFGDTAYDEWYFRDVEKTVEIINRVLEQFFTEKASDGGIYSNWDISYRSSW